MSNSDRGEIPYQGRLVKVSEAAEILSVSESSIRNYCRLGHLDFTRTIGQHRRVSVASIRRWLGYDEEPEGERLVVCYARVSTGAQRRAGNLDRQVERLLCFIDDQGMCRKENVLSIVETGSGLNENRKGFLRLIDLVVAGRVSHVVVEHKDRLARYGVRLFEVLCEKFGVTIIITNSKEDVSEQEEMASDIMSLVTVYAARSHGKRGAEVYRLVLTDEFKSKVIQLYRQGLSLTSIATQTQAEGMTCPKTGRLYAAYAVKLVLSEQEKIRKAVGVDEEASPIEQFINENCVRHVDGKCFSRPFHREFSEWSKSRGLPIPTKHALFKAVTRLGFGSGRTSSKFQFYLGFALRNNDRASRSHLA